MISRYHRGSGAQLGAGSSELEADSIRPQRFNRLNPERTSSRNDAREEGDAYGETGDRRQSGERYQRATAVRCLRRTYGDQYGARNAADDDAKPYLPEGTREDPRHDAAVRRPAPPGSRFRAFAARV
jgi:hypothetical protein